LLIARAREGKCVVRLKGGDPTFLAGAARKPRRSRRRKFILKSCWRFVHRGGPNYAAFPHPSRHCSSFTVFTGHEDPDDAKTLCAMTNRQNSGTKVVLMGTDLSDWTNRSSARHVAGDRRGHDRWADLGAGNFGDLVMAQSCFWHHRDLRGRWKTVKLEQWSRWVRECRHNSGPPRWTKRQARLQMNFRRRERLGFLAARPKM